MTDLQEKILLWMAIAFAGLSFCLILYVAIVHILNYEGYFCSPVESFNKITTLNTWCGHGWTTMTNSTGSYWEIKGWAFGDFP